MFSTTNISELLEHLKKDDDAQSTDIVVKLGVPRIRRRRGDRSDPWSLKSPLLQDLHDVSCSNESITLLEIQAPSRHLGVDNDSIDQWLSAVFISLSHLPNLKTLRLKCVHGANFVAILGPALPVFLQQAKQLECLALEQVSMYPNEATLIWQQCSRAIIKGHASSLKAVEVIACPVVTCEFPPFPPVHQELEQPNHHTGDILRPFLLAVSKLLTLRRVTLSSEVYLSGELCSIQTVEELCHQCNNNLTRLEYSGWQGQSSEKHVKALNTIITTTPNLQSLVMDFHFTPEEFAAITALLKNNKSKLQRLKLKSHAGCHSSSSSSSSSRKLEEYQNGMIGIAKVLQHTNKSLQELEVEPHYPGLTKPCVVDAFEKALEVNYELKRLGLSSDNNNPTMKRIEFFIKLNRLHERGDYLLNSSKSRREWVNKLVVEATNKNDNDLSYLHYFLSVNPSLCNN